MHVIDVIARPMGMAVAWFAPRGVPARQARLRLLANRLSSGDGDVVSCPYARSHHIFTGSETADTSIYNNPGGSTTEPPTPSDRFRWSSQIQTQIHNLYTRYKGRTRKCGAGTYATVHAFPCMAHRESAPTRFLQGPLRLAPHPSNHSPWKSVGMTTGA